jgi:hypothetical protein
VEVLIDELSVIKVWHRSNNAQFGALEIVYVQDQWFHLSIEGNLRPL